MASKTTAEKPKTSRSKKATATAVAEPANGTTVKAQNIASASFVVPEEAFTVELPDDPGAARKRHTFAKIPDVLNLPDLIELQKEQEQVRTGHTNSLLADYRAAASAENALKARVAELKGSVLDLRGRSIQYTILQREVDTNRALYDALLQRYKQIGVAGGVGIAPVSIVDRADAPRLPFKPNLFLNLLLGLGLGLAAGIAGAIGLEFIFVVDTFF